MKPNHAKLAIFGSLLLSMSLLHAGESAPQQEAVENTEIAEKKPACKPERWKEAIAKFEKADEKEPPKEGGVLFVGSSSIRMWDLPRYFPNQQILINRGFGGSEICDSVHYFDTLVAKHRPKVVVMYAGDNDISRGKKARQVHGDFVAFNMLMRSKLPDARLIYIGIKPSIARWKLADEMQKANKHILADCKREPKRLAYIDIWKPMLGEDGEPRKELFIKDGLHLSDEGYQLWTNLMRQRLFSWGR